MIDRGYIGVAGKRLFSGPLAILNRFFGIAAVIEMQCQHGSDFLCAFSICDLKTITYFENAWLCNFEFQIFSPYLFFSFTILGIYFPDFIPHLDSACRKFLIFRMSFKELSNLYRVILHFPD